MNFTYVNPTRIQFGQGQIESISSLIPQDKKVLVVYGGGSIKKNGIYQQVEAALQEHNWLTFSGVQPNPTVEKLDEAVKIVKEQNVNYILAVGGGSVIDGCKYIAAAALYEGDGWDILLRKTKVTDAVPIGAILTLPATGSESNAAAVVSKAETTEKLSFFARAVQPKFAVLDPDVIKTLPSRQIANGVVDAWVHTCEQYLTYSTNAPVQEGYAETLLRTLLMLGETIDNQDDVWRANLMWSANQALNGLIGSGVPQDWATHMIGHEITALYGVDHARSLAIIQPSLLRHQIEQKRDKLEQMGRNVFGMDASEDLAERTIKAIENFYHSVNVATQLTEYNGNKAEAIDMIATNLKKHGMARLGEKQSIGIKHCREILQSAVA